MLIDPFTGRDEADSVANQTSSREERASGKVRHMWCHDGVVCVYVCVCLCVVVCGGN